jgi:hypothetical protein
LHIFSVRCKSLIESQNRIIPSEFKYSSRR